MINCFCGMADRRKVFSFVSSRDHCQRSTPSQVSDTPRAGFELVQNLSSGFVEWYCVVVITMAPRWGVMTDVSPIMKTSVDEFWKAQNLSSGFVEWSCAVVITATPRRYYKVQQRGATARCHGTTRCHGATARCDDGHENAPSWKRSSTNFKGI